MKTKTNHRQKGMWRRIVCTLLTLVMLLTAVPMTVFAAETAPEPDFSGVDLMNINSEKPKGFDTTTNPYGYGVGVPFLMVEQNELLAYTTYNKQVQESKYYEMTSNANLENFVKNEQGTTTNVDLSAFDVIQAIAFDPHGTGRKDHVAFVGIKPNAENVKRGYLFVVNTITGKKTSEAMIGNFEWLYNGNSLTMSTFQTRSILDIVAGDFDGDGKENIVVYAPMTLYNRGDKTTNKDNTFRGCILREYKLNADGEALSRVGDGFNLLATYYSQRYSWDVNGSTSSGSASHWRVDDRNGSFLNFRNKLGVSMTVDDFNQDGVDDIAVLSYCHSIPLNDVTREYYNPEVKIRYGSSGMTGTITNLNPDQTHTFLNKSGLNYELPVAAELTSGDLDGDGDIDLFLAGMLGQFKVYDRETKWQLDGYLGMDADYFYMGMMVNSGNANGSRFTKTYGNKVSTRNNNEWTYDGYFSGDYVWQKLAVEAVAINGKAAAEQVFVNGTLYDCSAVTGDSPPVALYTPDYFKSGDDGVTSGGNSYVLRQTSFNSYAVGNFDGNDAGREQVIFRVALQHDTVNSHSTIATGYLRGVYDNDKTVNGEITEHTTATGYASSVDTSSYTYLNANTPANSLLIAVDRDYDGILAKYRGPEYAYTDPEVKAVLQAAPYFSDISDAGNNETEFVLTESYELTQSSSNNVSFSVGYVGEFGADEGPKFSIEAGYAMDWTESFENSLAESYTDSFSAQAYNSVVMCRIPMFIYCFDIQKTDGTWQNKTAMQTAIPQGPVYEQLSVNAYNTFVDEYNTYMAARNDSGTYYEMQKIDSEKNYLANNEGNPYSYNQSGWGVLPDGKAISKTDVALGKNGGINKVSWDQETAYTESIETSHGFYFSFTFTYGFPGQSHGVSTSLEYSHGKGKSTTKGTAIGASCSVTDINGPELINDGVPEAVVNAYGFRWALGQWTQHLSGESDNKTPFIGFNLTGVTSPAPAVTDLRVESSTENSATLSWTKPEKSSWPEIAGYNVYRMDNSGKYELIGENVSPDATSYTVTGLEGNTEYVFVITTMKTLDNKVIESIWSNQAYTQTAKNYYTVTIANPSPEATDLRIRHLGNVDIEDGDEIPEENIIKITACPSSGAYALVSIEITEGEDTRVVLTPDANGNISYSFVLNDHTAIRVNTKKYETKANVTYTENYFADGLQTGTIAATKDGSAFLSGSSSDGDVVFTATAAEGYILKEWIISFNGKSQRIPAEGSNIYTLIPETGNYDVYAEFVRQDIKQATISLIPPEGGSIIVTDEFGATYIPNEYNSITVAVGTTLNFNAIAHENCTFAGWVQDAAKETTTTSFTKTIEEDFMVGAEFIVPLTVPISYDVATGDATGIIAETSGNIMESMTVKDSVLTFTAQAAENYRVEKWTVTKNGTEEIILADGFSDHDSIEVVADAELSVSVSFIQLKQHPITFPSQIDGFDLAVANLTNDGEAVNSGDTITEGTLLIARLSLDPTYIVKYWTINGEDQGGLGTDLFYFYVTQDIELGAVAVNLKGDDGKDGQDGADGKDGITDESALNLNKSVAIIELQDLLRKLMDDVDEAHHKELMQAERLHRSKLLTAGTQKELDDAIAAAAAALEEIAGRRCAVTTFTDVDGTAWYHDAIDFVLIEGIMQGLGNGIFAPDNTLTRSMMVQILYNMEGRPAADTTLTFVDVNRTDWYYEAVMWAAESSIVLGVGDGRFDPNGYLTREQAVTMLYRYEGSSDFTGEQVSFRDANMISPWAYDAVGWAMQAGIVQGIGDNTFDPTGSMSRACAAQIMMNYFKR